MFCTGTVVSLLTVAMVVNVGCTGPVDDKINGYEYVDLGLSVVWATCNVGAEKPEAYGDYYAWGETETKSSYTSDSCETYKKDIGNVSGTDRDVAHVKWGGTWRMPTDVEFNELIDNCDYEWTIQNGVEGGKFTSRKNGNSIFLPAAGYRKGAMLDVASEQGWYWSSTPDNGSGAYGPRFDYDGNICVWNTRFTGLPVHPVAENPVVSEEAAAEETESSINGHEYVDLGLSVKWATRNVGARSREDAGDLYAWGEMKAKPGNGGSHEDCEAYGKELGDIGGTSRDVARVKWGGTWRMPTEVELRELTDSCTLTWATLNGVEVAKFTSHKNGNAIYLPFNEIFEPSDMHGNYWSSTPDESGAQESFYIDIGNYRGMSCYRDYADRRCTYSVRPVSE